MWPGTLWQPWPNFNAGIPGPQGGCGPRCIPRDLSGPRAIGWVRGWTRVESWRDVAGKKRSRKKKVDSCGHHTTYACISFAVIQPTTTPTKCSTADDLQIIRGTACLKKKIQISCGQNRGEGTYHLARLTWLGVAHGQAEKGKGHYTFTFFFP